MGCGSSKKENNSEKIILLKKIKEKVQNLIEENPFYNISIKEFQNFMKEKEKEKEQKNNKITIENLSKNIIARFFKEENIINYAFKNVASFSYSKIRWLYNKDEKITKLIFYFIFLFLTKKQRDRNDLLYKKVNILFEKIKLGEENGKIIFRTGKFSFILLNLIQFCTFCFISFFCGPGVIEITGNFKKSEVNTIFSNNIKLEKYHPNNINKLLNDYLYFINHNIQPNTVNYMILTDVLQPLSDYISENKDEEIFTISPAKLKEILDILIKKMNHNYYLKLFFNTDKQQN